MERFSLDQPGATIAGAVCGTGSRVVCLHPGVADQRIWQATLPALSNGRQVITYDRRGFGETVASDEAYSHVDDLKAVLQHTGTGPVALIGCSQGARVAIDLALAEPDVVSALVLVSAAVSGAPAPPPEGAWADMMEQLEAAEEDDDLARVNAIEARFWLDGPLGAEGRVGGDARQLFLDMNAKALSHQPLTKEVQPHSAIEKLGAIAVPAMVVWGDLDFPHIQARSRMIMESIPAAEGSAMKGCAHLPSLEQPGHSSRIVERFLETST